ncbi:glycosyltransferase family A protein [Oceanihabitans sp. 2_MG-2023]|uniref:glycosyltransferase family 2 protein n=1 Tax=Oceanihabitans sp. 2_MG-2023 TaxID=3062661 RepID=UPI0026E3CFDA|nr:glycosyltransferase family A protein [Oceanihabitans sp. 2_MG-2023]MDO6597690.1 glycosyltransferase family A protein [Oceanihabitans sp. 2_MG-2023]
MSLSIITPHYNDFEGLKRIYSHLQEQTHSAWDWVIVDDKSDANTQDNIVKWHENLPDSKVQLYLNTEKTNASVCRNLGADLAKSNTLVFLDSDDKIAPDFVANRNVKFTHFAVFKNYYILNENEEKIIKKVNHANYLDCFLAANFIWQTSCVLWNRVFFKEVGRFNPKLKRLQDIELSVRAIQHSTKYSVIDNTIDFYYKTKPISERKNFVLPVCNAVHLFISKLLETDNLNKHQLSLISGYYFLCVRYFERSGSKENIRLVQKNLSLFYKKKHISVKNFILGYLLLKLYNYNILSAKKFVRGNRYLFKPKQIQN